MYMYAVIYHHLILQDINHPLELVVPSKMLQLVPTGLDQRCRDIKLYKINKCLRFTEDIRTTRAFSSSLSAFQRCSIREWSCRFVLFAKDASA